MRKVGDRMAFSGGAEDTPIVQVTRFISDGFESSMNDGDTTLQIHQGNKMIQLSPETIQDILDWYKS
jgi:hypothetical protein